MKKYVPRDAIQIIYSILNALSQGELKVSHLSHKLNLDYVNLRKYLNRLDKLHLVYYKKFTKGRKSSYEIFYHITAEGFEFRDKLFDYVQVVEKE